MPDRTRIKICGLKDEGAVEAAVEAGADAVGFVFAKSSPRYIDPEQAADLVAMLPPFVLPVGVFGKASPQQIIEASINSCVQTVQLHGTLDESALTAISSDVAVIRGLEFDPSEIKRWSRHVAIDALLIDGSQGGGGSTFDWTSLAPMRSEIDIPFIVAGGLDAENVSDAIATLLPFAVDVSSGVESSPGVKDPDKISAFCRAVRLSDAAQ